MTVEQLQYIIVEAITKTNEPIYGHIQELSTIIKRMTEMIMDLDVRAKFDNDRIKALELDVYNAQRRIDRQETMIMSQGIMPLE